MQISVLDFILINIISAGLGLCSGLIICCKNKEKFFIKSCSLNHLSDIQNDNNSQYLPSHVVASTTADCKMPVKITLE